jgi:hypothetical protein
MSHDIYSFIFGSNFYPPFCIGARYITTSSFVDLENAAKPADVVKEIIQLTIDEAIGYARREGQQPDRLIVVIHSENLDTPITVHLQKINANSVDSVVNRFEIVDQSNRKKGQGSLYGAPVIVDVSTMSHNLLKINRVGKNGKTKKKKLEFTGSGRRLKPVRHNINRLGIIAINNDADNFCLIRALLMTFKRATLSKQRFHAYKRNQNRQTSDVRNLMITLAIPLGRTSYSLEEFGQPIVDYFNQQHPNRHFKIFSFSDFGMYKFYYSSEENGFVTPLCLFYDSTDEHFDAVSSVCALFDVHCYCFSCMKPYKDKHRHSMKCSIRCMNCATVDTLIGRCKPDITYEPRRCDGCEKLFESRSCDI